MRYLPAIRTNSPETISAQPGQWIIAHGTSRGRFMGRRNGVVWIAWGTTATKRFPKFAALYNAR